MSHGPHPAWWEADPAWSALLVDGPAFSLGRFRDAIELRAAADPTYRLLPRTWQLLIEMRAEQDWRADWTERLRLCLQLHARDIKQGPHPG